MKHYLKLALLGVAAVPVLASAQTIDNLYIYKQLDHFGIDGVYGGGPFLGDLENPNNNNSIIQSLFLYCDSIPQEFYIGQTFLVEVEPLDTGMNTSLDPWVLANANSQASQFASQNHITLDSEQIESAIQGVVWDLDGQLTAYGSVMTSNDPNTALFANYLYNQALSIGTTNVPGYSKLDAGINYPDGLGPTNGQSQVAETPEPSALLGLALPALGIAFRRRAKKA